jgi:hypothetical protein
MSQPVYLEETSYRLIERLTLATERIADKIEEHVPPAHNTTNYAICPYHFPGKICLWSFVGRACCQEPCVVNRDKRA